jgi:hypothetical protein
MAYSVRISQSDVANVRLALLYVAVIIVVLAFASSWAFINKPLHIRGAFFLGYVVLLCLSTILSTTLGYMYDFDEMLRMWGNAYQYRTNIPGFLLIPTVITFALTIFWYPHALKSEEKEQLKKKEAAE